MDMDNEDALLAAVWSSSTLERQAVCAFPPPNASSPLSLTKSIVDGLAECGGTLNAKSLADLGQLLRMKWARQVVSISSGSWYP